MKILAVDDKKMTLEALLEAVRQAEPEAEVIACRSSEDALACEELSRCSVAFLDIELPGMNGICLAKELKMRNPRINIIFATGYSEYAQDALELHCSGYLMKPVTPARVRRELDNLRYPVLPVPTHRLRIQCFGNFEVFLDGKPVEFKRNKTKEMLAYLVDRQGAVCSSRELMAVLWEDQPVTRSMQSNFRNLVADLRKTLSEAGQEGVLLRSFSGVALNVSTVDCDFYDFLKGIPGAVNSYRGEYMSQYSWAEMTTGTLITPV